MEPKYKFTDETKTLDDGTVLHRIEALRELPWVFVGTLGGWIESEQNLSHEGDCWVSDNAQVYGHAIVDGNAKVYGKAEVFGNALVAWHAKVYEKAIISGDAWVSGWANIFEKAKVFGNAEVYEKAYVSGNQKVNGYCWLDGEEEGKKFKIKDLCICDYNRGYLKKYQGCCWEISQVYEGWVQAKHGDEEVAFRNEWLIKL